MSNRTCVPDGCATEPHAAGARATTPRVLVVDDDAAACALTRETLRWLPFETSTASSAAEALELAPALRPDVIVVSAALAEPLGAVMRDGALAAARVVAFSSGGESAPVADVVLRTPVDTLELLATVRLLAARAARACR